MKQILIATTNPGKLAEIKRGLKELERLKIKFLTLNDVRVEEEPTETGSTFKENSLIKAQFYGKKTGMPTIGDDGGLIIPYLDNQPGVKSRRWPGYEASDKKLIDFCLINLRGCEGPDRTAYLVVNLCFFDPQKKIAIFEEEKTKGYIAEKPSTKRIHGYPFRSLFIIKKFNKYYDHLTEEQHEKINHRLKAAKRLAKRIIDLYNR